MRLIAAALAVAVLGSGSGTAQADTLNRFTSFWALGDSLSDAGNLFAATQAAPGGPRPAAPYFEGRFSNGPVWAEHVAGDFAAQGLATGNFAFGGATVGPNTAVPNLAGQIDAFASASAGRLGARPVASLPFGANDLIAGVAVGAAAEAGALAAQGVAAGAMALGALKVRDVAVFSLPPLDRVPAFAAGPSEAREQARLGALAFNAALDAGADDLRAAGLNVIEIDVNGLFNELIDDPQSFGVRDAATPCYVEGVAFCGHDAAPLLAFFDPPHPNAVIHAAFADRVRAEITPVPPPAPALLLITALAGLALARRRRR